MPQPNEIVNVWTYITEWSRCISARYQRDMLYRNGEFDDCSKQYNDLKMAFRAKSMDDQQEALDLLAKTYYKTNLGSDPKNSPTAGKIHNISEV